MIVHHDAPRYGLSSSNNFRRSCHLDLYIFFVQPLKTTCVMMWGIYDDDDDDDDAAAAAADDDDDVG